MFTGSQAILLHHKVSKIRVGKARKNQTAHLATCPLPPALCPPQATN